MRCILSSRGKWNIICENCRTKLNYVEPKTSRTSSVAYKYHNYKIHLTHTVKQIISLKTCGFSWVNLPFQFKLLCIQPYNPNHTFKSSLTHISPPINSSATSNTFLLQILQPLPPKILSLYYLPLFSLQIHLHHSLHQLTNPYQPNP